MNEHDGKPSMNASALAWSGRAATYAATGVMALLLLVLLASCHRPTATAPEASAVDVIQTGFPGQVTAGGGTSGEVMAVAGEFAQQGDEQGTPGIPQGSGGNTGGAELGATQNGESSIAGETTHAQNEPSDSGAAPSPANGASMQVQTAEAGGAGTQKTPTSMAGLRRPPVFPARTLPAQPESRIDGASGDSSVAKAAPSRSARADTETKEEKEAREKRELDAAMQRITERWRSRAQRAVVSRAIARRATPAQASRASAAAPARRRPHR